MLEPRAHFTQPVTIRSGVQTELLLDRRIDEDTRHIVIFCRQLNHAGDIWRPQRRHHAFAVTGDEIQCLGFKQLRRTPAGFRQLQENIHIQTGLMAGVSAIEATARWHPHIAD
ncbi:hypothetical protein D3C72_1421900 [compost metagenome]